MDNSFFNSKTGMDLNDIIMEEISPYDNSYPIHFFANGLKDSLKQAEKAAKDIYRMVLNEVPIAEQIKQANKKGFRLVVDTTDSMLDAIDKGKIKWTTEKNGQTFAQIRKPNGQYGSKLPIKREEFAKGISKRESKNGGVVEKREVPTEDNRTFEELMNYLTKDLAAKCQQLNIMQKANMIITGNLGRDDEGEIRTLSDVTPSMIDTIKTIIIELEHLLSESK